MKLLALETANEQCSVCFFESGKSVFFELDTRAKAQTQAILPMIEAGLAQTGWALQDLTAIAFSRGPGSFSGVRINAAVCQALAWANDLPVIPVSTLQALAQRAYQEHQLTAVTAVLDARMSEVYLANYQLQHDIMQPCDQEQLLAYAAATEAVRFSLVGSGAVCVESTQDKFSDVRVTAQEIAQIAYPLALKKEWVDAAQALPVYLRDNAWKKISEQGKPA